VLVHKKVIKEKDAPCRIPSEFPVLLTKPGGELNSPRSDNARRLPPSWLRCSVRQQGRNTPASITGRLQLMG